MLFRGPGHNGAQQRSVGVQTDAHRDYENVVVARLDRIRHRLVHVHIRRAVRHVYRYLQRCTGWLLTHIFISSTRQQYNTGSNNIIKQNKR